MDILRITTLSNGERIGTTTLSKFQATHKEYCNDNEKYAEELLNSLNSKEYVLDNIEGLQDGDYLMELFREIPYAAHIVREGEPIPIHKAKPLLRYIGESDNL